MRLPFFIAKRYLFSPKKRNAINIISLISTIGVAIGTTALIVVMSVMNGLDVFITDATESFSADITLFPAEGKYCASDPHTNSILERHPKILYYNNILEESALAKFGEILLPVAVKGVDSNYGENGNFIKHLFVGDFSLRDGEENKPTGIIGLGIASTLRVQLGLLSPITIYYPNRRASTASINALNSEKLYPISIFSIQQELDNKYILADIEFAQKLFDVPGQISKIEIKIKDTENISSVKKELTELFGKRYQVKDKYDLNKSYYSMIRSEKLVIFLILLFILFIASFNIIGSITMLIIDKKDDVGIFTALGMSPKRLIAIFNIEGNLITSIGAAIGLIAGIILVLVQEHFGLVKLGEGSFMVDAYPVKLIGTDIFIIILAVLGIGLVATWLPVRYLIGKQIKN